MSKLTTKQSDKKPFDLEQLFWIWHDAMVYNITDFCRTKPHFWWHFTVRKNFLEQSYCVFNRIVAVTQQDILYTPQNLWMDFPLIWKCFSNSRLSSFRTRRSFHCFRCFWCDVFNLLYICLFFTWFGYWLSFCEKTAYLFRFSCFFTMPFTSGMTF